MTPQIHVVLLRAPCRNAVFVSCRGFVRNLKQKNNKNIRLLIRRMRKQINMTFFSPQHNAQKNANYTIYTIINRAALFAPLQNTASNAPRAFFNCLPPVFPSNARNAKKGTPQRGAR